MLTELSGAEISAYVAALAATSDHDQTVWSGFATAKDLTPDRRYRVVISELEWTTRFVREVKRAKEHKSGGPLVAREFSVTPSTVTFISAMTVRVKELTAAKVALADEVARLRGGAGLLGAP